MFETFQQLVTSIAAVLAIAIYWVQYRRQLTEYIRTLWKKKLPSLPPWFRTIVKLLLPLLIPAVTWLAAEQSASDRSDSMIAAVTAADEVRVRQLAVIEAQLYEISTQLEATADRPAGEGADPDPEDQPPPPPTEEIRLRTYDYGETNDHCAAPYPVAWRREATDGWRITNVDGIGPTAVSSRSVYGGVEIDPDGGGFTVRGRIVNNGDCVRILGETVARDGRGTLRIAGTYEERREVP